jgi:hypothetical protein
MARHISIEKVVAEIFRTDIPGLPDRQYAFAKMYQYAHDYFGIAQCGDALEVI